MSDHIRENPMSVAPIYRSARGQAEVLALYETKLASLARGNS